MKRHFRRHLLDGDAVTRPSEGPADGVSRLRVPESDDETPLSSEPSGLPWNQTAHSKSQRVVDKKFSPGLQTYMRVPAEFLLNQKQIWQQNDGNHTLQQHI